MQYRGGQRALIDTVIGTTYKGFKLRRDHPNPKESLPPWALPHHLLPARYLVLRWRVHFSPLALAVCVSFQQSPCMQVSTLIENRDRLAGTCTCGGEACGGTPRMNAAQPSTSEPGRFTFQVQTILRNFFRLLQKLAALALCPRVHAAGGGERTQGSAEF